MIRLYCRTRKKLKSRVTRTILCNPGKTVVGLAIEAEKLVNSRDPQGVKPEILSHGGFRLNVREWRERQGSVGMNQRKQEGSKARPLLNRRIRKHKED